MNDPKKSAPVYTASMKLSGSCTGTNSFGWKSRITSESLDQLMSPLMARFEPTCWMWCHSMYSRLGGTGMLSMSVLRLP